MKALITGASSGIGREIAKYLAKLGYDLIIVARNLEKLNALKAELPDTDVQIITKDFNNEQDSFDLYEQLKGEKIDFLVNNAGYGAYGKFTEVPLEKEIGLIHTNIVAVHVLTKLFLRDMIKRNSGYIMNVGSAAGFLAGPTFSSYYASKNYVVRLTQAIHEELRRDKINVKVSALCPGPVQTNFNDVANVKFCIRGLTPEYVAKYAVDKTLKGKMIITPGFEMKATKFIQHFASEKLLTRISYNVQMKKNGK
ncbi:MAG: SDR family oxidoreductase [Ruminococcus sp.]|nr:SDR family oxidoreductase [Ruminococcus sp.]